MEVCEVCGAFLIVGDAQSRVDDHLMGKQHMGYAKIKSTVEELKVMGSHVANSTWSQESCSIKHHVTQQAKNTKQITANRVLVDNYRCLYSMHSPDLTQTLVLNPDRRIPQHFIFRAM